LSAAEIVNKVWNYAHVLRDDGVGYGDYVEAAPGIHASRGIRTSMFVTITYLISLKMADERLSISGKGAGQQVPSKFAWAKLVKLDGDDLALQYRHTLESLGKEGGLLA
jgi:type I restriction enzyme M protein